MATNGKRKANDATEDPLRSKRECQESRSCVAEMMASTDGLQEPSQHLQCTNGKERSDSDLKSDTHVLATVLATKEDYSRDQSSRTFEQLRGLDDVARILNGIVGIQTKFSHWMPKSKRADSGVLLHGPPGTGKTELARTLAQVQKMPFFNVGLGDVLSRLSGDTEK